MTAVPCARCGRVAIRAPLCIPCEAADELGPYEPTIDELVLAAVALLEVHPQRSDAVLVDADALTADGRDVRYWRVDRSGSQWRHRESGNAGRLGELLAGIARSYVRTNAELAARLRLELTNRRRRAAVDRVRRARAAARAISTESTPAESAPGCPPVHAPG